MLKNKKIYVIPIFGFLAMIVVTTILLKFPICNNAKISIIDAFFEATSMITATGSTVVDFSKQFTFLGQFICLLAMQIGAIGFMLFFSLLFLVSKEKMKLSDSLFLSNEISSSNFSSVKKKAKRIIHYTFVIEFFGAWLLAFRFVPIYGMAKGLWMSLFHSVSAFCNVGADIIGASSFAGFRDDVYLNIVLIILMFLGSLGYFVLEDLTTWFCTGKRNKRHTQSRIIIDMSVSLVVIGVLLIKMFDPQLTILEALFEVVTARNTGFFTIDINGLHEINKLLVSIIMFIGGGPGSNAGGIRVVVLAILLLTTIANIRDRDQVVAYYRNINDKLIKKAVAIFMIDALIVFLGVIGIALTEQQSVLDTVFYVVSSFTNTGLATFEMTTLTDTGKIISMLIMYIGRIAPITFVSLFTPIDHKKSGIKYPDIDLML